MTSSIDNEIRKDLADFLKGGTLTDGSVNPNTLNTLERYFRTHQTKLIQQLIDEVIGADEKARQPLQTARNLLRATQRTKLKELLKERMI